MTCGRLTHCNRPSLLVDLRKQRGLLYNPQSKDLWMRSQRLRDLAWAWESRNGIGREDGILAPRIMAGSGSGA